MFSLVSSCNISNIEKIQKRFTKRLYARIYPNTSFANYESRLSLFKLTAIKASAEFTDILTLFKIIHKQLSVQCIPLKFSSLNHSRLIVNSIKSGLFRNSFFHRSLTQWNSRFRTLTSPPLSYSELRHLFESST